MNRLALLSVFLALPLAAEEPKLVSFSAFAGEESAHNATSQTTRFIAGLRAEGKIVLGQDTATTQHHELARLVVGLEMRSLPGAPAVDITAPQTWGPDLELRVGAERALGEMTSGPQTIETALVGAYRWATSPGDQRLAKYPGQLDLRAKFSERTSGAYLEVGYSRTDIVGGNAFGAAGLFPLNVDVGGGWKLAALGDALFGTTSMFRVAIVVRR